MGLVYAKLGVAAVLLLVSIVFLMDPILFKKAPFPFFFVWIIWALPMFRFLIPIVCCVTIFRCVQELRAGAGDDRGR